MFLPAVISRIASSDNPYATRPVTPQRVLAAYGPLPAYLLIGPYRRFAIAPSALTRAVERGQVICYENNEMQAVSDRTMYRLPDQPDLLGDESRPIQTQEEIDARYVEHAKLHAIGRDRIQQTGNFLRFVLDQPGPFGERLALCGLVPASDDPTDEQPDEYWREFELSYRDIEVYLHRFYGLNEDRLERERRDMIKQLRLHQQ